MGRDSQKPVKYYGKYRGVVQTNIDPLLQGRILAKVPAIPEAELNWAMPCMPYVKPDRRSHFIPPLGTHVWIEFEGGDIDYPIWTGCFWGPDENISMPPPTDAID